MGEGLRSPEGRGGSPEKRESGSGGGSATDVNELALQAEVKGLQDDILAGKRLHYEPLSRELIRTLGPFNALMALELMRSTYDPRT